MSNLWEHEGMEIVAEGLDEIFPHESYRPSIIFYDNGCGLRRWREANPDPGWMGTRYIVDRWVLLYVAILLAGGRFWRGFISLIHAVVVFVVFV